MDSKEPTATHPEQESSLMDSSSDWCWRNPCLCCACSQELLTRLAVTDSLQALHAAAVALTTTHMGEYLRQMYMLAP